MSEINNERQRLLEEARKESYALRSKLEATLNEEQNNLTNTIARKTQEEVFAIARKTLKELADQNLEDSVINVFIQRLKTLKEEQRQQLAAALLQSNTTIAVKSAFDLTEMQKQKIENPVKVLLGNNVAFNFSTVPDLVSGIELSANGYKLTWSISEYLDSIKKVISESVTERSEKSSGTELNNMEEINLNTIIDNSFAEISNARK